MTPLQRIETLEEAVANTDRGLDHLTQQTALIRGVVNELSMDMRVVRHDLGELDTKVGHLDTKVGHLDTKVDSMSSVQQQHSVTLKEHGDLLRQILQAVGGPPVISEQRTARS